MGDADVNTSLILGKENPSDSTHIATTAVLLVLVFYFRGIMDHDIIIAYQRHGIALSGKPFCTTGSLLIKGKTKRHLRLRAMFCSTILQLNTNEPVFCGKGGK